MEAWKRYNKLLKRDWGTVWDGRPKFRLHLTDRQVEKRAGLFQDWYGDIFIREYVGVREMPKYNYLGYADKPHWVLEGLFLIPGGMPDVKNSENGIYEPLHVFPHVDGVCQLPPYRALQIVLCCIHYGPKKTMSDYISKEREDREAEIELFKTILDNEAPYMAGLIHDGSGTSMPRNYPKESPHMAQKGQ